MCHGDQSVSILLCLYNGERFLDVTLSSAFAQQFREFELIVVDDGSTDNSHEVLARYKTDPRLRVLRQLNRGTPGALETGLRAAQGKYVAFLDQDDLWEPGYLLRMMRELSDRPETDMVFSGFQVIDEHGRQTGLRSRIPAGRLSFTSLFADFIVGGNSNLLCRRSAVDRAGGVDTSFRLIYNVDLCLRVALLAPDNIACVQEPLMRYRRHSGQLSRDTAGLAEEWARLVNKLEQRAPQQVAAHRNRAYSNHYRYLARMNYEAERHGSALRLLWRGFRSAPLAFLADARNWVTVAAGLCGLALPRGLHRAVERLAGYRRSGSEVLG